MSRYWDSSAEIERRIYRALLVQEYVDGVDALEYIARDKGVRR